MSFKFGFIAIHERETWLQMVHMVQKHDLKQKFENNLLS